MQRPDPTAPMSAAEIKAEQDRRKIEQIRLYSEWVVSPDGDVTHHVLDPGKDGETQTGFTILRMIEGKPDIRREFKEKGYTLFSEECRASGEPEKIERMREIAIAQAQGLPVRIPKIKGTNKLDMSTVYPRTVMEKRALGGFGTVAKGKAYVVGEGVTDDPEVKRKLDEKLESLGLEPPEKPEPAEPEQRELPSGSKGRRKGTTSDGT